MLRSGQQIGRYKILSAIGSGGMGEVFLAEDTRLDRQVALKIPPVCIAEVRTLTNWDEPFQGVATEPLKLMKIIQSFV